MKKRKFIPWSKKKDSANKHEHPEGPRPEVFDLACEILDVLCENGGTMHLHDVADEVLGPDGYVGDAADAFDDAYDYLHGYSALEVVTYCEHEKPALVRAKTYQGGNRGPMRITGDAVPRRDKDGGMTRPERVFVF